MALYEQSQVTRIDYGPEVKVHTAQGTVRAKTLVLACNAYLNGLNPQLSGKVLPAGSYIIATEPLSEAQATSLLPQNMAVCDQRVTVDYFRLSADHRLLFGGATIPDATPRISAPICDRKCCRYSRNWPT